MCPARIQHPSDLFNTGNIREMCIYDKVRQDSFGDFSLLDNGIHFSNCRKIPINGIGKQEQLIYSRITALSKDFICIYTVNPETDEFTEYSANKAYEALALSKHGSDFFNAALKIAKAHTHPDDVPVICREWSKENIMKQIQKNGIFRIYYRILFGDRLVRVCLKAVLVEETEGPQLIIGVTNADIRATQD